MIADHLMVAVDSVPELRHAYGHDPHFAAVVANVLTAANHGSDDIDQLRILLAGLASVGAALVRCIDGLTDAAKLRPSGPWLVQVDGSLVEFNPKDGGGR